MKSPQENAQGMMNLCQKIATNESKAMFNMFFVNPWANNWNPAAAAAKAPVSTGEPEPATY